MKKKDEKNLEPIQELCNDPEPRAKAMKKLNREEFIDNNICSQMIFEPQINWDGRLLGCCTTFQADWKLNVFKYGLVNCLNSDFYRQGIYNLLGDFKDDQNNPCNWCYTYRYGISKGKHINI